MSKKRKDKKMARILNHKRQMWWLRQGIVMLPTVRDEILMRKEIAAMHKNAE